MTKTVVSKSIILTLLLFSFAFYSLSEETPKSDNQCKGLPKEQRFSALGFELGMCKWEVDKILQEKDKQLEEVIYFPKEDRPESMKNFITTYVGAIPPIKPESSYSEFLFDNNVLRQISAYYKYENASKVASAFLDLNSILTKKYGQPKLNDTMLKRWELGEVDITLVVGHKEGEVVVVYTSEVIGDDIEEYKFKKYGEGF